MTDTPPPMSQDEIRAMRAALTGLADPKTAAAGPPRPEQTTETSPEEIAQRYVESVDLMSDQEAAAAARDLNLPEAESGKAALIASFPGGIEAKIALTEKKIASSEGSERPAGNSERPVTGSRVDSGKSGGIKRG
ncbi:hypothetical protein GCM10009804_33680 [Kribbella hippodromi]|uniref:Scaffolding protein n=1 Tax=Kribbella hippodromi TaxID=434347 RepID=A0ABP4P5H2_9ACTN